MFDHADTMDAPKVTDSKLANSALIDQVNAERKASPSNKNLDQQQGSDTHVNAVFGALTIVGNDAQPADAQVGSSANNVKGDSATNTVKGDSPAAQPKSAEFPVDQPAQQLDQAALDKIQTNKGVNKERNELENNITKLEKAHPEQMKQLEAMRDNMEAFEERAASQKPPLSPEEVQKFYHEVNHVMEVKDGPGVPVKQADRVVLAEQMMLHASNPNTIDQGDHQTCNVTTVESRMFSRNPSAAAHLIGEVATTGSYTTTAENGDKVTVKMNADNLLKHKNRNGDIEENNNPPKDGERSYASQIFQVTAVNLAHQTHDMQVLDGDKKVVATYPAGTVEYRQEDADANAKPPHSGETLYDKRTNQPITNADGKVIHQPNLQDDEISDVYNQITGGNEKGIYITHKDDVFGEGKKVTQIGSEDELKAKIEEAKKEGKLPIILAVNSGQEPFYSDSHGGAAGGAGGGHVVTVTDFDAKTGAVQIDNQWGSDSKHAVDMHELYLATMKPEDAISSLEKDCAKDAKEGKVDYSKELELLRLKHSTEPKLSDAGYDQQLVYLTKQAVKDAQEHHGGVLDTRTETELEMQLFAIRGKDGKSARWAGQNGVEAQIYQNVATAILTNHGRLQDTEGETIKLMDNYTDSPSLQAAVNQLHDGGNQYVYFNQSNYDDMCNSLKDKSPAELQEMDKQFQAKYGESMEAYIKDTLKRHPEQRDRVLRIVHEQQGEQAQAA